MLRILFVPPSWHMLINSSALPLQSVRYLELAPLRQGHFLGVVPYKRSNLSSRSASLETYLEMPLFSRVLSQFTVLKPPKIPRELLFLKYRQSISALFWCNFPDSSMDSKLVMRLNLPALLASSACLRQRLCLCAWQLIWVCRQSQHIAGMSVRFVIRGSATFMFSTLRATAHVQGSESLPGRSIFPYWGT